MSVMFDTPAAIVRQFDANSGKMKPVGIVFEVEGPHFTGTKSQKWYMANTTTGPFVVFNRDLAVNTDLSWASPDDVKLLLGLYAANSAQFTVSASISYDFPRAPTLLQGETIVQAWTRSARSLLDIVGGSVPMPTIAGFDAEWKVDQISPNFKGDPTIADQPWLKVMNFSYPPGPTDNYSWELWCPHGKSLAGGGVFRVRYDVGNQPADDTYLNTTTPCTLAVAVKV